MFDKQFGYFIDRKYVPVRLALRRVIIVEISNSVRRAAASLFVQDLQILENLHFWNRIDF